MPSRATAAPPATQPGSSNSAIGWTTSVATSSGAPRPSSRARPNSARASSACRPPVGRVTAPTRRMRRRPHAPSSIATSPRPARSSRRGGGRAPRERLGRRDPVELGEGVDEQPGAEEEEQPGGAELDGPLRQVPAELAADDDGQGVRRDHAERRAEPGAEPAVLRGEGDRGEHRLVAQLGQEERDRRRDDRRARRALGLAVRSSSVSVSPRRVQAPNPRNATAATSAIQPVGSAAPRP